MASQERFSIAHVTPYPWEAQENEVNAYIERVARELSARGHRVLILAPSRSQERVRASRKALRAARGASGMLGAGEAQRADGTPGAGETRRGSGSLLEGTDGGTPRVIAVGEVLDLQSSARNRPHPPGQPPVGGRPHCRSTSRGRSRNC